MFVHEVSADHRLQLPTEASAQETVALWRNDYRNLVFTIYPQAKDATDLISASSEQLLPFLPGNEYQAELKLELELLHVNTKRHITRNVPFLANLFSIGLAREEAYKAIALTDIIMHGESMIYRALHIEQEGGSTHRDRLAETLESLGVRVGVLHSFGELNGVSLESDSDEAASRGNTAAHIVSMTRYFPSAKNVERCIFTEKMQSGSASIFRSNRAILIGTGLHVAVEGEEYDLAERIRVILHEGAHAEQREISETAQEYSALDREITGFTSIRMLIPMDIAPYYWQDLMDWLSRLRDHTDASKANLLSSLADPDPKKKLFANHNIGEMEKENNIAAGRLDLQRRLNGNPENIYFGKQ